MLPQRLREMFGLDEEALFAGMGEHFQIWAPEAYGEDMAGIDDWRAGLDPDERSLRAPRRAWTARRRS